MTRSHRKNQHQDRHGNWYSRYYAPQNAQCSECQNTHHSSPLRTRRTDRQWRTSPQRHETADPEQAYHQESHRKSDHRPCPDAPPLPTQRKSTSIQPSGCSFHERPTRSSLLIATKNAPSFAYAINSFIVDYSKRTAQVSGRMKIRNSTLVQEPSRQLPSVRSSSPRVSSSRPSLISRKAMDSGFS